MVTFIPLIVLLSLLAAAAYGIYRYGKRYPPASASSDGLSGVAGWLLLLVIGLMLLGPVIGTLSLLGNFGYAEYQNHALKSLATWDHYKAASLTTYLAISCVSLYGGWKLLKGRNTSVVRIATVVLWIVGPVASISLTLLVPLFVFGKIESDESVIRGLIGSIIYSIIWTLYLFKSKRVCNTYGVGGVSATS